MRYQSINQITACLNSDKSILFIMFYLILACEGGETFLPFPLQNDQRRICSAESSHCFSPCRSASGKRNHLSQQTPVFQCWQTRCRWTLSSDGKTSRTDSLSCGFYMKLYQINFFTWYWGGVYCKTGFQAYITWDPGCKTTKLTNLVRKSQRKSYASPSSCSLLFTPDSSQWKFTKNVDNTSVSCESIVFSLSCLVSFLEQL